MNNICPVCASQLNKSRPLPDDGDGTYFSCPQCGDFILSGTLITMLPSKLGEVKDGVAKLSHALRLMQRVNKGGDIDSTTITKILKRPLPSAKEQADLLLRWLAENVQGPGERIWVNPDHHCGIIGAKSPDGFDFVLSYLTSVGLIEGDPTESVGQANVTLSFDGWEYYEQLRLGGITYRKAFMAMEFGDAALDGIFKTVFKPCVGQTGFELFNLGEIPRAGLIDDRLRVEIQSSDFLIADLTHNNNGAYWEAGYAEGLRKPVIYTCEKELFEKEKTHFDTNHQLTILWDKQSPQEAGENLKATIRATFPALAKQHD